MLDVSDLLIRFLYSSKKEKLIKIIPGLSGTFYDH
jgi:hypothetical protein